MYIFCNIKHFPLLAIKLTQIIILSVDAVTENREINNDYFRIFPVGYELCIGINSSI